MTDFKRLGDIATYINGYAFKPEDRGNEGLPIIRIQDLTGNSYDLGFYNGEYSERIEINNGDVLISWSGSLGVYLWNKGKALLNQHIFKVVFDKAEIDKSYFIYAIQHYLKEMEAKTHGATMKHITKKDFDDMLVPYPNMQKQRETAGILSMVDGIIVSCQQELTKLDELVKSRFVEMFGDPFQNPFGWKEIKISEVLGGRVSNGYFAKREDYVADGNVAVLGVANVVNRMYSQCAELPRTNASLADIEKYRLQYGDMLFCRSSLVSEGIGKASIVPRTVQPNTLFECHVIRLPLNLNLCVPEYMQVLTTTEYFRQQILSQAKTATMTTIGQEGILKSLVLLPPLDLQQQFLSFVSEVDKSKLAVKQSLEKLEMLKKSLMQEYFG